MTAALGVSIAVVVGLVVIAGLMVRALYVWALARTTLACGAVVDLNDGLRCWREDGQARTCYAAVRGEQR